MNWDAIGAISQLVGALVVFISLVYLALQIRHSTKLAESQYHSNSVGNFVPIQMWKSDNPDLFHKGMTDFEGLTVSERIKVDAYLHMMLYLFKDTLEAYERGFIDEDTYLAWDGYVGAHLSTPGGKEWWESAKFVCIPKVKAATQSAIDRAHPYHEGMKVLFENR